MTLKNRDIFGNKNFVCLFDFFCGSFVPCVSHAFMSVHCCLVVTCCERADLLALVGDVYCIFVLPHVVSWVRCGTVSFPDLCRLS